MFFWVSNFVIKSKPNDRLVLNFVRFVANVKNLKNDSVGDRHRWIRNIGLVAHIDAGKTTTTERILYYSGRTLQMGEVHHGDTVMDYMAQERERGITITMAAASIDWHRHRINLIDTPGHVDFTFEVERSLSVLDGAVVILDAAAGVQAQTIKVWQQACRYQISRLIYLNKMDKPNISIESCLTSIERKLQTKPLMLQVPVFSESKRFIGLIDLVDGAYYQWLLNNETENHQGRFYHKQYLLPVENDQTQNRFEPFLEKKTEFKLLQQLLVERESLIGKLAEIDENFGDYVLSLDNVEKNISIPLLVKTLRNACLQNRLVLVTCGSSFKNIGVQPLLDSICRYLPNPLENFRSRALFDHYTSQSNFSEQADSIKNLCLLAFKIYHHPRLGPLTYVRIYSGSLLAGMNLYNLNQRLKERISKIYQPLANNFADLGVSEGAKFGDIVAVSGLISTITGDTLIYSDSNQSQRLEEDENFTNSLLAGIKVPDPVYYCSLELPSLSKTKQLNLALENLQREDPSLKVSHDKNTQQIVIKGQGELHIDIIKDRIKREYGVEAHTGSLQISYKETITKNANASVEMEKSIGNVLNRVKLTLEVKPTIADHGQFLITEDIFNNKPKLSSETNDVKLKIINTKERNLESEIRPYQLKAIHTGIRKALEYGPLFFFSVTGVEVVLHNFETTNRTSMPFIANTVSQCMMQALQKSNPILLEPIMRVEVVTPENFFGVIMSDLNGRRSHFDSSSSPSPTKLPTNQNHLGDEECCLVAFVPLSEMFNYSTTLRTISSGMASFDWSLHSYRVMDDQQTAKAIKLISGID